ncbi:MAG: DUF4430 domain-containing protein [Bacillota bacterium]|nr:DUF4430 domain-containing protein [Bacillota bacterium]
MKRNPLNWKHLLAALGVVLVLALAFWAGGAAPGTEGLPDQTASLQAESTAQEPPAEEPREAPEPEPEEEPDPETGLESRPGGTQGGMTAQEKEEAANQLAGGSSAPDQKGDGAYSSLQGMPIDPATGKDPYGTQPVPEGKPVPVEPQEAEVTDQALTCTLTVRCDSILAHMDWLDPEKAELVPDDGVLFPTATVTFYEGESVFHVLQREMKKAGIHLEFTNTPVYNSAYIEGIGNLYEYDCGELSGWMYQVNGWFPNYGCSRYPLQAGDDIQWVYTCDLGLDVGGRTAA